MRKRAVIVSVVLSLVLQGIWAVIALAQDVPRMTQEELKGLIDKPEVVIIDVRANVDWLASNLKIKGALREDPRKVSSWIDKYPKDKTFVFYCS